jgi:hypothetical protein
MLFMEETVRFNLLCGARSCLIAFVVVGMLNLPLVAASAKPLGMVVIADRAKVDSANAAIGADVFSGDALSTETGGSLRMKVGASQVYLLSSTAATLIPEGNKVQAKVTHGTLGFSTSSPDQLEIGTPLGIIQGGTSQRVFAQVAVLSPTKMQISAYQGSLLVIAPNGDKKTIGEGETYEATVAAPEPIGGPNQYGVGHDGINWKHVGFVAGVAGTLAVVSYLIWHEQSESCTIPTKLKETDCD